MVLIAVDVPDNLAIRTINETDLPTLWKSSTNFTKDFGKAWVNDNTSAVMSVPSAVVPNENNYLLNPEHPDFSKITFSAPQPFVFDPRLK
jgi:RES domain-containing protein